MSGGTLRRRKKREVTLDSRICAQNHAALYYEQVHLVSSIFPFQRLMCIYFWESLLLLALPFPPSFPPRGRQEKDQQQQGKGHRHNNITGNPQHHVKPFFRGELLASPEKPVPL